jgi:hypothetical protein
MASLDSSVSSDRSADNRTRRAPPSGSASTVSRRADRRGACDARLRRRKR